MSSNLIKRSFVSLLVIILSLHDLPALAASNTASVEDMYFPVLLLTALFLFLAFIAALLKYRQKKAFSSADDSGYSSSPDIDRSSASDHTSATSKSTTIPERSSKSEKNRLDPSSGRPNPVICKHDYEAIHA